MEPGEDGGPPRAALAALVVIVLLVLVGLWLTHRMGGIARLQDCYASGRTNCESAR